MRSEDLGIDPKFGTHDQRLTPLENRFLAVLWEGEELGKPKLRSAGSCECKHQGLNHAISANDLAVLFLPEGQILEEAKRDVRRMHNHLLERHDKIPILSKSGIGGGYYMAENKAEADEFYHAFRQRGMTSLKKASRARQAEMVDMVEQLSFEFDDLVDKTGKTPGYVRPGAAVPTPVAVVDSFLDKMMKNPKKYAGDLRKIGEKLRSVLLPKEQVGAVRAKVLELQEMVAGLEG
jgi:hypothetical protein